jgi:hypothetical protein
MMNGMLEKYRDAYESMYRGSGKFIDNFQQDQLPEEARIKLNQAKFKPGDRIRRYAGVYDTIARAGVCKDGQGVWTVFYWLGNSQYPYFEHELKV